ncbi:MAG: hypothetical protein FWB90_00670 [Fibromonadales bacterium]|nr:hypothetical protein [Fibromonadales bacterium]
MKTLPVNYVLLQELTTRLLLVSELEEMTRAHREKCKNYISGYRKNYRKTPCKNYKKDVIITDSESVRITKKCKNYSGENVRITTPCETPTNAEVIGSAGVSAGEKSVRITGGLGGGLEGGSFNSNNNKNNVTDNDVTCVTKKEKINKKEKSENVRITTLLNYSEDFEKAWKIFPKKTEKEKSFELWQEYQKAGILPNLEFIIEALKISSEEFGWESMEEKRFIQSFRRWLHNKEWRSVEDRVNIRLEKRRAQITAQQQCNACNRDFTAEEWAKTQKAMRELMEQDKRRKSA